MFLTSRFEKNDFLRTDLRFCFSSLLKVVELITHLKVYTLLLNVDYIPYINAFAFPELIEVGFHLVVSIALAICLYLLFVHLKITSRKQIIVQLLLSASLSVSPFFLQRPSQTKHLTSQVFPLFILDGGAYWLWLYARLFTGSG